MAVLPSPGGGIGGEYCTLGQNVNLGPGVRVGNGVKIQNNVSVYQGVTLKTRCSAARQRCSPTTAPPAPPSQRPRWIPSHPGAGGGDHRGQCDHIVWADHRAVGHGGRWGSGHQRCPLPTNWWRAPRPAMGWVCRCGHRLDRNSTAHLRGGSIGCGEDQKLPKP